MRDQIKKPIATQSKEESEPGMLLQPPGGFGEEGFHSLGEIAIEDDSSLEQEEDSIPAAAPTTPIEAIAGETATGKYKTFEAFKADVLALPDVYPDLKPGDIEKAFEVYQNAVRTDLDLAIVGRLVEQSSEAAPGIDDPLRKNFTRMNEGAQGGSVLNSDNWTMLMNDAWLLGGLHSTNPFYLASGRTSDNVKGTNAAYPMTVTGRELIGITSSGYEIVSGHPSLGEVARPVNTDAARSASLITYAEAVQNAVAEGRLKPEILQQIMAAAEPI
jgi:hypothetical protein